MLLLMLPLSVCAQKRNASILVQSNPECRYCVMEIQNAFAPVKGIKKVEVDTIKQTVRFVYHSSKMEGDSLKKILNQLGYTVDGIPGKGKKTKSAHHPNP